MSKISESDIIKGCKAKDRVYQKELVLRYSSILLTIARRYTNNNFHLAQDVLQESFVLILRGIDQYKENGFFLAWMKKIVINNALKKKVSKRANFEEVGIEFLREQEIEPDAYNKMGAEQLMELIDTLPDGYKDIFNLSAIEGYTHSEIAMMQGITASTSRSQLTRARKMLQAKLLKLNKIKI